MRLALGLSAALLLAACGGPITGPGPAQGTVNGTVTVAPCRPVERAGDPPCPPRPGITVHFQPVAGGADFTAVTGSNGTYALRLPAGEYNARSEGGIGPGPTTRVTVAGGQTVIVNFDVDSGIR